MSYLEGGVGFNARAEIGKLSGIDFSVFVLSLSIEFGKKSCQFFGGLLLLFISFPGKFVYNCGS